MTYNGVFDNNEYKEILSANKKWAEHGGTRLQSQCRESRQEDLGAWLTRVCNPHRLHWETVSWLPWAPAHTCASMNTLSHPRYTQMHMCTHANIHKTLTYEKRIHSFPKIIHLAEYTACGKTLQRPDADNRISLSNPTHADTLPFYECIQFSQFIRQANQDIQRANLEGKFNLVFSFPHCHSF